MIHNSPRTTINDVVNSLKNKFKEQVDLQSEFFLFDAAVSFDEAMNCIISPPLFSELKIVVINNVQAVSKEQGARLADSLSLNSQAVIALTTEGKAPKGLLDKARRDGKVLEEGAINAGSVAHYIEKQFALEGKKITRQANQLIAQQLGGDLALIKSEIQKISVSADKDIIDINEVKPVLSVNPSAKIFEMIDAVSNGDIKAALQKMGPVALSTEPLAILNLLKRHYRLVAKSKGLGANEIVSKLRQPQFVAQKLSMQARRYDIIKMRKAFGVLLLAEKESKSGKNQLFSIQKAIIELAELSN